MADTGRDLYIKFNNGGIYKNQTTNFHYQMKPKFIITRKLSE